VVGQSIGVAFMTGTHMVREEGQILEAAQNGADPTERIAAAVAKLGDSPFAASNISVQTEGTCPFVPVSLINELRRRCTERLERAVTQEARRTHTRMGKKAYQPAEKTTQPLIAALVTTREQANAAVQAGADMIYAQPRMWSRETLRTFSSLEKPVVAVLPPVLLEEQLKIAMDCIDLGTFSGAAASNIGQIKPLKERFDHVVGDYTLNAANTDCAMAYINMGLDRVTLSVELTAPQIRDIIKTTPAEVIGYGRLPMMNLLHCPMRERSGRCEADCMKGNVITDRKGYRFTLLPLTLERGKCNIQLLNSLPIDGLRAFDKLMERPPKVMRLNFYTETPEEVRNVTAAYRRAIDQGEIVPFEHTTGGHFARGVKKRKETKND